jgi:ribosome-binding factor A
MQVRSPRDSDFKRADRVGALLCEAFARVLVDGLIRDPRLGFCTATEVRLSDDLRHARVFVSVLGDEAARNDSLRALAHAAGFIKRELGQRVKLRYIPELRFELDSTLDEAERLEQLLRPQTGGNDAKSP